MENQNQASAAIAAKQILLDEMKKQEAIQNQYFDQQGLPRPSATLLAMHSAIGKLVAKFPKDKQQLGVCQISNRLTGPDAATRFREEMGFYRVTDVLEPQLESLAQCGKMAVCIAISQAASVENVQQSYQEFFAQYLSAEQQALILWIVYRIDQSHLVWTCGPNAAKTIRWC